MSTKNTMAAPTAAELTETKTREKVYKVVRYGTAGKHFWSALAGRFGKEATKEATGLAYEVGKVTNDVADGEGIFIYLDKAYALDQAAKMANKTEGRGLAVLEAKPIGDVTIPAGKSKTATCGALLCTGVLTPTVWQKVDPADLKVMNGRFYIEFRHNGVEIANLKHGKLTVAAREDYRVEVNDEHFLSIEKRVKAA